LGDREGIANSCGYLGHVAVGQGDLAGARARYTESLALFRELKGKRGTAEMLCTLGMLTLFQGNPAAAHTQLRESLVMFRELGDRWYIALCLTGLAWVAIADEQLERATRLLGAETMLREIIGAPVSPLIRAPYELFMAQVQAQLTQAAFEAAWARGRAMMLEQAIEYALSDGSDASERS